VTSSPKSDDHAYEAASTRFRDPFPTGLIYSPTPFPSQLTTQISFLRHRYCKKHSRSINQHTNKAKLYSFIYVQSKSLLQLITETHASNTTIISSPHPHSRTPPNHHKSKKSKEESFQTIRVESES
jgi:hypothetical protein